MAARSNALLSAIASAVRVNPRLSAGLAFEIGVMVGAFVRNARGRKGIAGATAKLIDAAPIATTSALRRSSSRKPAARRASSRSRRRAA
jgi:hypothetical protein